MWAKGMHSRFDLNVDRYFGERQELRHDLEQLQELLNKLALGWIFG